MKALILAAGFGTRLRPHTRNHPKPLFPINGEPVIAGLIRRLIRAGCSGIIINTHHLHEQLEAFIHQQTYPVPVLTRYEPVILGTGGAIRNVSDFLDNKPFLVINSDIVTDLDLAALYAYHCRHGHPVTLVMHDHEEFNSVAVDEAHFVRGFTPPGAAPAHRLMAFTGIQVLDSCILERIPPHGSAGSIDVYQALLQQGGTIKAYVPENFYWQDIGTPRRYIAAVFDHAAPRAFFQAFHFKPTAAEIRRTPLTGDGSDRSWQRLACRGESLIMAGHGIQSEATVAEIDSFIHIGRHLFKKGLPVPEIFHHDRFSGLVFLQDLGDTRLFDHVRSQPGPEALVRIYRPVIRQMIRMALQGAEDFDPAGCYQSPAYDKSLILEKECRYFVEALLNGCLGLNIAFEGALAEEFSRLADHALEKQLAGFLHRDLQSRNIMIHDQLPYFIDFQAGRIGPVQYDLAALLNDPYADLPERVQETLLNFAVEELRRWRRIDTRRFLEGYAACRLTRGLQTAGAFGFLTTVKQKPFFQPFIPVVLRNLDRGLTAAQPRPYPHLARLVRQARTRAASVFATGLDV